MWAWHRIRNSNPGGLRPRTLPVLDLAKESTVLQSQKAVTAYFSSKQLLPFVFSYPLILFLWVLFSWFALLPSTVWGVFALRPRACHVWFNQFKMGGHHWPSHTRFLSKYKTFVFFYNVEPTSKTFVQYCTNVIQMCLICCSAGTRRWINVGLVLIYRQRRRPMFIQH